MQVASLKSFLKKKKFSDFNQFQSGLLEYLGQQGNRLQINQQMLADIIAASRPWVQVWTDCSNSGVITYENRLKRKKCRKEFTEALISFFDNAVFPNPNIGEIEWRTMGLRLYNPNRKPFVLDMLEIPEITIHSYKSGVIRFKVTNNSGGRGLPEGARLLEIRYTSSSTEPDANTAFENSAHFSRCFGELRLSPATHGRFVFVQARWLGSNNNNGVFCKAIPAVVLE